RHLTIVGGDRERWVATRRGRGRDCAPAALLWRFHGPSTSPLGVSPMAFRLPVRAAGYLLAWVLTACTGPAEPDKKGVELIAQAKAATGGDAWDRIEIWHETGRATSPDIGTVRYEHWHDAQSLSTRNVRSDLGGAMHYVLFNGKESYQSTDAEFHDRTPID